MRVTGFLTVSRATTSSSAISGYDLPVASRPSNQADQRLSSTPLTRISCWAVAHDWRSAHPVTKLPTASRGQGEQDSHGGPPLRPPLDEA